MHRYDNAYYQYRLGMLDADRWEMHRADIAQMLSSPGVARWWGVGPESPIEDLRARPTHYSPEFVAPVEEILGEQADRGE
jgi:hypothetical protein